MISDNKAMMAEQGNLSSYQKDPATASKAKRMSSAQKKLTDAQENIKDQEWVKTEVWKWLGGKLQKGCCESQARQSKM